jgi:hypothetical protein
MSDERVVQDCHQIRCLSLPEEPPGDCALTRPGHPQKVARSPSVPYPGLHGRSVWALYLAVAYPPADVPSF